MHDPNLQMIREEVSALREHALAVLEELAARHVSDGTAPDVMVALQSAANEIGTAERALPRLLAPEPAIGEPEPSDARHDGAAQSGAKGASLALSAEAAAVLALAESTVPYALTRASEAEVWLRLLRRHGVVGRALAEMGFSYGELIARAEASQSLSGSGVHPAVARVRDEAMEFARARDATEVTTADILFALLSVYRRLVDRVLYGHSITREHLVAQLALADRVESG